MKVIDRHKSIDAVAAYEATLEAMVGHFRKTNIELKELVLANQVMAAQSKVAIGEVDTVLRAWGPTLRLGPSHDSEDIGITHARTPESILDSALTVMEVLRGRPEPLAAQVLGAIEAQYSIAVPAYDATQAGRVAVQAKQRALQAAAADLHAELVKLRKVVRSTLGWSHIDYQRMRLRNARPGPEDVDDVSPQAPETSPETDPASEPSADS
jgi:hypothetical protein